MPIERVLSIALRAAGDHAVEVGAFRGACPARLPHQDLAGDAAALVGLVRGRRGHVVVGHHRFDPDPVLGRELDRHLHVHVVAGIVAVQAGDALSPVGFAERGVEALGGGRSEHLADRHRVHHSRPDIAQERRLVTRPAAGHHADARLGIAGATQHARVVGGDQEVGMRPQYAGEAVLGDLVWIVDHAVHAAVSSSFDALRVCSPVEDPHHARSIEQLSNAVITCISPIEQFSSG